MLIEEGKITTHKPDSNICFSGIGKKVADLFDTALLEAVKRDIE